MKKRYLHAVIQDLAFSRNKMAFVSGPRQCGKTTFAKMILSQRKNGEYYNWDDIDFRRIWVKSPKDALIFEKSNKTIPLFIFDEIHKAKGWKGTLKGIYDTVNQQYNILVTGSARLNVYKKGSDSLMGRYLNFRLHPFTIGELRSGKNLSPDEFILNVFKNKNLTDSKLLFSISKDLFTYGGFPEPYFSQSEKISRIWRKDRVEKIVREDLRDLSRLPELSQIEMMMSLLPERAGQPLSIQSLREDLEVSYDTVKRWLHYSKELYYHFEVKPWAKSIPRSLKKEGKLYLWDWAEVKENGSRFENMIACHLLKACHFWTDTGEGNFELYYLKNKEKKEIDFLITRDRAPWLPVECKFSENALSPNFEVYLHHLKTVHFLQITSKPGILKTYTVGNTQGLVVSFASVFSHLP